MNAMLLYVYFQLPLFSRGRFDSCRESDVVASPAAWCRAVLSLQSLLRPGSGSVEHRPQLDAWPRRIFRYLRTTSTFLQRLSRIDAVDLAHCGSNVLASLGARARHCLSGPPVQRVAPAVAPST